MKAKELAASFLQHPEAEILVIDYKKKKWSKNIWVRFTEDYEEYKKGAFVISYEKEK